VVGPRSFEHEYAIRHFQVHQDTPGEFTLKIVKNPGCRGCGG